MLTRLRQDLVGILCIVAYVNVLPFFATYLRGDDSFARYADMFIQWFPLPSVIFTVAAGPLVVAWAIRQTQPATCRAAFIVATLLLLSMNFAVIVPAYSTRYNALGFVLPWLIPIVTAAMTSGAMLVVGLSDARRPELPASKGTRVVRPASRSSNAEPGAKSSVVYSLGLLAGVGLLGGLGVLAWVLVFVARDRAQVERQSTQSPFTGVWNGSYTSSRFGGGSAELELGVPKGNEIQGTWILEPTVPLNHIVGLEPSIWTGRGRLTGAIQREGEFLVLTLLPTHPYNCMITMAMNKVVIDGVSQMQGSWRTVTCVKSFSASGQITLSRPAPPER